MTAFTRGRLDVENGARDVLATTRGPKLNAINGCGLTTRSPNDLRNGVDVVMLSKYNERPHSSSTQFMQYISHSHDLDSILLQLLPFESAGVTAEECKCVPSSKCQCVVFRATKEIMIMLAHRLPGTLKLLPLSGSESQCLLPSPCCLIKGCHRCNEGLLYVEAGESSELGTFEWRLRSDNRREDSRAAAVCEALDEFLIEEEESSCICIPVRPRNADRWTKFMIKFLKSKEKEAKRIKVVVSDALQHYITHSDQEFGLLFKTVTGCIAVREIYESASLILPRVAEVIVNMVLTGWLRVDGLSSSLVARRAIRDCVVDSTGTGFAANAFLTQALVFGSADGTNVCEVLCLRGGILSARRVSYMVGCVNLICSITWSVLIACEGNWAPSTPLSTPRLAVIIGAVGVALGMDCFEVYGSKVRALFWAWAEERAEARALDPDQALARLLDLDRARAWAWVPALETGARLLDLDVVDLARALDLDLDLDQDQAQAQALGMDLDQARAWAWARARGRGRGWDWGLVAVVILEVGCIVSLVVMLSMKEGPGRWVYSGMQVLVWVKWGIGSFLLGDNATEDEDGSPYLFWRRNRGTWVYCSAFLLNAMLAGVRRKWVYSI